MRKYFLLFIVLIFVINLMFGENISIDKEKIYKLSELPLKCIKKEFPNKPSHVLLSPKDVLRPRHIHPSFYGCFDWHSSVHGHWLLVYLLKKYPQIPKKEKIIKALDSSFKPEKIKVEAEYFLNPQRATFERMYGWAWFLKLSEELYRGRRKNKLFLKWFNNLKQLREAILKRYFEYLPKLKYPIRVGFHQNTAFGLSFALDYSRTIKNKKLEALIMKKAKDFFFNDKNYPAHLEPGGEDFFSPALLEAELMGKVLGKKDFLKWLKKFLPKLEEGKPETLFKPPIITSRSDPKIVHLDGLNFSRAWMMWEIAKKVESKKLKNVLINSSKDHFNSSFPYVVSGEYGGEHWLATFALYALKTMEF